MRNIRNSGEEYLPIICSRQFVKTNEIDKGKRRMPTLVTDTIKLILKILRKSIVINYEKAYNLDSIILNG